MIVKNNVWVPFAEIYKGNYKIGYDGNQPISLEYINVTPDNVFDKNHFYAPEDGFIFGNHKDYMFFIPAKRIK